MEDMLQVERLVAAARAQVQAQIPVAQRAAPIQGQAEAGTVAGTLAVPEW